MSLTKEEIVSWKNDPLTKRVLEIVQEELDEQIAYMSSGASIRETADATAMETCRVVGLTAGLSFIFSIEEDEYEE